MRNAAEGDQSGKYIIRTPLRPCGEARHPFSAALQKHGHILPVTGIRGCEGRQPLTLMKAEKKRRLACPNLCANFETQRTSTLGGTWNNNLLLE